MDKKGVFVYLALTSHTLEGEEWPQYVMVGYTASEYSIDCAINTITYVSLYQKQMAEAFNKQNTLNSWALTNYFNT